MATNFNLLVYGATVGGDGGSEPGAIDENIQVLAWDPYLAPFRKGSIRPDLTNGMSAWWRPRAIDSEVSWKTVVKPITEVVTNHTNKFTRWHYLCPAGSPAKTFHWNGRGGSRNLPYNMWIADGITGYPDPLDIGPPQTRDSLVSMTWYDPVRDQWFDSETYGFENRLVSGSLSNEFYANNNFMNDPNVISNPANPSNTQYAPQVGYTEQGHLTKGFTGGDGLPKYFTPAGNAAGRMQLLKKFELETPGWPIRHAIGFIISRGSIKSNPYYRWPAESSDGDQGNSADANEMGTLFSIPSSVDLSTLGLSEIGLRVGRAIQNYGLILTDGTGLPLKSTETKCNFNIEETCEASTKAALDADFAKLFPSNPANAIVKIVDNNDDAQLASGGSTPVTGGYEVDNWNAPGTGHTVTDGTNTWNVGAVL